MKPTASHHRQHQFRQQAPATAYQGGRNSGWTCQPCPIDWTVWLHYSCPGRTPQTKGARSQLTVHMHLHHGRTGCHTHSTVPCTYAHAAWPLKPTAKLYLHTCLVYMHSLMYCIVRSRPSRAVQPRAGSGSLSLGSREFASQFPGCCIAP